MHFTVIPWLSRGSPTIAIQLLPHRAFCEYLDRDGLEENTAVSWWVFAEKSLYAPSLGKGTPVVAEKLTDPYKNKKKHTPNKKKAVPLSHVTEHSGPDSFFFFSF